MAQLIIIIIHQLLLRLMNAGSPSLAAYNDKVRLVPFGEFIPGGKWMEIRKVPIISTSLLSISSALKKQILCFLVYPF